MGRFAKVERTTKESNVRVELELDGSGTTDVSTGVPFYDHMMTQIGKHGGCDLVIATVGDIEVDSHHTVEDTSLAFGAALRQALGDKVGMRRFGDALVPLDESLARAVVDLSGGPYVGHDEPEMAPVIGAYDTTLTRHVWESISASAPKPMAIWVASARSRCSMVSRTLASK